MSGQLLSLGNGVSVSFFLVTIIRVTTNICSAFTPPHCGSHTAPSAAKEIGDFSALSQADVFRVLPAFSCQGPSHCLWPAGVCTQHGSTPAYSPDVRS